MISSKHKNVEIKGSAMEGAEDFALIVFELQNDFGKEGIMFLFSSAIAASDCLLIPLINAF